MLKAAIFDMDGTLINSEPMWQEAEREVFSSVGVDVSEELSAMTASMTTRAVTEFWYSHYPWSGKSLEQVEAEVVDRVAALIAEQGRPLEGVREILDFFRQRDFRIGLATNAPYQLIPVVLDRLGITEYFHAVSSSEHEAEGKPDPAVYLATLDKLGVTAAECLAFEDSLSGIMAATRARIRTVALPPAAQSADDRYGLSHLRLPHLGAFTHRHLEHLWNAAI